MCFAKKRGKIKRNHLLLLCHSNTRFITDAFLSEKELKGLRLMKRDRLAIIADILETAKDGAKKTRIMYGCNLSYRQTKKHLNHLLKIGFLRKGNSYHTTEKGLQFLQTYHTLELLLNTRN